MALLPASSSNVCPAFTALFFTVRFLNLPSQFCGSEGLLLTSWIGKLLNHLLLKFSVEFTVLTCCELENP